VTSHSLRANGPLFDLHARLALFAPTWSIINVRRLFFIAAWNGPAFSRAWSERLKRGTNSSREMSGRWNRTSFSPSPATSPRVRSFMPCRSYIARRYVANSWAWSNVFPAQFTVSTARCIYSQSPLQVRIYDMVDEEFVSACALGSKCPRPRMSGPSSVRL